jgi:cobalt/nickel transport system permease protein
MLHTFRADEDVGYLSHIAGLASHHQNFQAVVMIQMDVERGKNRAMKIVLDVGELVAQHPDVMVVHQRDGADYRAVGRFRLLANQFVAYQIPERLRPVGVSPFADQLVELTQKIGIDRNADPAQAGHGYIITVAETIVFLRSVMLPDAVKTLSGTIQTIVLPLKSKVVHIPDGFLATPVWATLDVAAAPALWWIARRAQSGLEDARIPRLGIMGAFVFAAQMIDFPVAAGTTAHLVGGALLAVTLGPFAASAVMAAILAIQALVFQDGGILALGANTINMAILGVLAGYAPFHYFGSGRWRRAAVFAGGAISVLVSAAMALSELRLSGVPPRILGASIAVFSIAAVLEGAITVGVLEALESIQPGFVRKPEPARRRSFALGAAGVAAILLATVGVQFAAAGPDGIEKIARDAGLAYKAASSGTGWPAKAAAGFAGLLLIYAVCVVAAKAARRRSA